MIRQTRDPRLQTLPALFLCLVWVVAAGPLPAQIGAGDDIVEEDLGFELEGLLGRAEEVFLSADQPSSIPLFSEAILMLDGRRASGETSTELDELLIRSLFFRAEASFNLGERQSAQEDLERILRMQPDFEADTTLISRKLREMLKGLRGSLVGEVDLLLDPADAMVSVDGRRMDPETSTLALLAGPHTLVFSRPGYDSRTLEIDLPAGEVQEHDVALNRTSAVLRLLVRPSGTTVLVDGQAASAEENLPLGALPDAGTADLTIWNLAPGSRRIEIRKEGFRPTLLEVDLADLEDYGLPPVRLEPTRGTLTLTGAPTGARILVNGEPTERPPSVTGEIELVLPPGEHTVRVTAGPLGEYERSFALLDQQSLAFEVELKPSLVFLGVLGGDRSAARDLAVRLTRMLGDLDGWALLDRTSGGANLFLEAGIDTRRLRRLATGEVMAAAEPEWTDLRGALDRQFQGSLYLLAVLTDDLFATDADLWFWSAEPGPARPRPVRLPLEGAAELASLAERLEEPLVFEVPWVGARFADSAAAAGALVVGVTSDGPAAQGGLAVGDVISLVDGTQMAGAQDVRRRVADCDGAELTFEVAGAGAGTAKSLTVVPAWSPRAISLTDRDLLDPAASAVLAREESQPEGGAPGWLLGLDRALLHMRAGDWPQAVRVLRNTEAPQGPGLGQAAVDYWLAVALLEEDRTAYEETARGLFSRAAGVEGARLQHHDGPLVVTRARARLESNSP